METGQVFRNVVFEILISLGTWHFLTNCLNINFSRKTVPSSALAPLTAF